MVLICMACIWLMNMNVKFSPVFLRRPEPVVFINRQAAPPRARLRGGFICSAYFAGGAPASADGFKMPRLELRG
jgi:hypothetical protein